MHRVIFPRALPRPRMHISIIPPGAPTRHVCTRNAMYERAAEPPSLHQLSSPAATCEPARSGWRWIPPLTKHELVCGLVASLSPTQVAGTAREGGPAGGAVALGRAIFNLRLHAAGGWFGWAGAWQRERILATGPRGGMARIPKRARPRRYPAIDAMLCIIILSPPATGALARTVLAVACAHLVCVCCVWTHTC